VKALCKKRIGGKANAIRIDALAMKNKTFIARTSGSPLIHARKAGQKAAYLTAVNDKDLLKRATPVQHAARPADKGLPRITCGRS
jgi:hypothetical protein